MFDAEVAAAIGYWGPQLGVTIPSDAVQAIIAHESLNGTVMVTNEAGGHHSYGPMMVLDTTASDYGVSDPSTLEDPATGIYYGVGYFGRMLKLAQGDLVHAISMYNGGRKNSDGTYTNPDYVTKVLGILNRIRASAAPIAAVLLGVMLFYLFARKRRAA